jgi:fermentation-respiration switch protein FrsA (DUF1100 family)
MLLWSGVGVVLSAPLGILILFFYLRWRYLEYVIRIFQEKPLFIIPRGQPAAEAENVSFQTPDGITLSGCYFRSTVWRRKGVILFGLEFGSNRWACLPYCEHLLANGFDIFTFESRNQGDSDSRPGYDPLPWVTKYEVTDMEAALAYLKARSDGDPRGIGFFGISKGGGAGLLAAARDPYIRCVVTDGAFATYTTMVSYMCKWIAIYSDRYWIQHLLPTWFYGWMALEGLRQIGRERGCRFPHLERATPKLSPRPLLMIHGEADTYIKPEMARMLFDRAGPPKEFWLVEGAKHNQAIQVATEEYQRRVLDFFEKHLAETRACGQYMGKTGNLVDGGGTGVSPVEEEATGRTRIPLGKTGGTPVPPTPWLPG